MDEEWTWANYPMPWCTRSEIREVSNQAQKIHDDIRHGHLLIHAHAHDGHTTVAVGTYLHRSGKSVYLHGEDHLRQVADTFDSPAAAMLAFEKIHAACMRPGPAPLTDTERAAAKARAPLTLTAAKAEPASPKQETVPAYLADAGDHDALLDAFLDTHDAWEKWQTWSDETTHAVHESLVLRAEFIHEAEPDDTQWKIAAYESPVGERLWHATASTTVPVEIMRVLLDSLASTDAADIAAGSQVSEAVIGEATRPLAGTRGPRHRRPLRRLRRPRPSQWPASLDVLGRRRRQPSPVGASLLAARRSLRAAGRGLRGGPRAHQEARHGPRRGLNALSHADVQAQPAPRAGSARSR